MNAPANNLMFAAYEYLLQLPTTMVTVGDSTQFYKHWSTDDDFNVNIYGTPSLLEVMGMIDAFFQNTLHFIGIDNDGDGIDDEYNWYPDAFANPAATSLNLSTQDVKIPVVFNDLEVDLSGVVEGISSSDTYFVMCYSKWLNLPSFSNVHKITWNEGEIKWSDNQ